MGGGGGGGGGGGDPPPSLSSGYHSHWRGRKAAPGKDFVCESLAY